MFASLFVLVGDHYQLPPLVKVIILVQITKNIVFLIFFLNKIFMLLISRVQRPEKMEWG